MSIEIPVAFVEQFSQNVHMLAEQRMSKLRNLVTDEARFVGEAKSIERIGTTPASGANSDAPAVVTTRHGDTPLGNTEHSRRWLYVVDYDVPADLIDKDDQPKMLIDPESSYTIRHAGVMGRGIDDAIVGALGGSVNEGKTGSTTTSYDTSNQQIVSSSTGLTLAKLRAAREQFEEDEIDDFYQRYLLCTPAQISDLLADDKVTSADFNTVRALVAGAIDTFMGFKFVSVSSKRLPLVSTERGCFAFVQPAVRFSMQTAPNTVVSPRPDKKNAKQIYTSGGWGAVRIEDKLVIRVLCTES